MQQAALWSGVLPAPIMSTGAPSASKIIVEIACSMPWLAARSHQAQTAGCFKWPFVRSAMQQAAFWSGEPSLASIMSTGAPLSTKIA